VSDGCPHGPELDAWERGGEAGLAPELERHLPTCGSCRTRVREIQRSRELFRKLPVWQLEPRRCAELEFFLMAETRRRSAAPSDAAAQSATGWRAPSLVWLASALGLLAFGAVAFAAVRTGREGLGVREPAPERADPALLSAPSAEAPTTARTHATEPVAASNQSLGAGTAFADPPTTLVHPRSRPARKSAPRVAQAREADAAQTAGDDRFRGARALLRAGREAEAVIAFDRLATDTAIDGARRADALFWSALAARAAGDTRGARERAERYLAAHPGGWYAASAAQLR